jgi:hypothetical protein
MIKRHPIVIRIAVIPSLFLLALFFGSLNFGQADVCLTSNVRNELECGGSCNNNAWGNCEGGCEWNMQGFECRHVEWTACEGCPNEQIVLMADMVGLCFCDS